MSENKTNLVVKNNQLNRYTFYKSPVQLKVFSKLIIEIRKNPENKTYRIPIKDLLQEINFKEKGNTELKKIVRKMGQMIEIPKEKGFKFSALFYDIETEDSTYLDFEVNPTLKPYLLELSNSFTAYYLENVTRLKSYYSIRLYELLKQYQGKDLSGWWKITIEELREILKIEEKQYTRYNDFKRKVIIQAQNELKEKTDIKFTFEEHKVGRKIERLTFYLSENKKQNTTKKEGAKNEILVPKKEKKEENKLYNSLYTKLGLDEKFIKEIFSKYDDEKIERNLKYTLKEIDKGTKIPSIGGYFRTALNIDYANQKTLFEIKKEVEADEKRIEFFKEEVESLFRAWKTYRLENIVYFIEANLEDTRKYIPDFIEEKEEFLIKQNIDIEDIESVKLQINNSKVIGKIFRDFLITKVGTEPMKDFKAYSLTKNINVEKINDEWVIK